MRRWRIWISDEDHKLLTAMAANGSRTLVAELRLALHERATRLGLLAITQETKNNVSNNGSGVS